MPPDWIMVYTFNEDSSEIAQRNLGWHLKSTTMTTAVDMSAVKPDRLGTFLDRWFSK
jgi:hypothetical protein